MAQAGLADALSIGRGQTLAWDVLCPTTAQGFRITSSDWVAVSPLAVRGSRCMNHGSAFNHESL